MVAIPSLCLITSWAMVSEFSINVSELIGCLCPSGSSIRLITTLAAVSRYLLSQSK